MRSITTKTAITGAEAVPGSPIIVVEADDTDRIVINVDHVESWHHEIANGVIWVAFSHRVMGFTSAGDDPYGPTNDLDNALYEAQTRSKT